MTHGFFNKKYHKPEDLLSVQCPYEGDTLETTQALFVTFYPADCHKQAQETQYRSHVTCTLLCFGEPLVHYLALGMSGEPITPACFPGCCVTINTRGQSSALGHLLCLLTYLWL